MPNQQLVDYINQCLAAGQTKEQIKQSLISAGWQDGDINEALGGVSGSVAIPTTPSFLQDQSASNQTKYAGFWIRYIASSVDGLILTLAVNGLPLILGFIFGNIFIIVILRFIGLLFVPIYFITMTYKRQATIGKKLANLMVISDKAENLTLGQVILRETIGRIISSIFFIGYIMVGLTQRKQGLHDKIAKTTVIYKDPNKKVSVWVIILGLLLPILMIIVIFGILTSFTLVGFNSAKTRANDNSIKAMMVSAIREAVVYYDIQESFTGFKIDTGRLKFPDCSGDPIINISSDGQELAIFGKACGSKKYFCAEVTGDIGTRIVIEEVDRLFVESKKTSCSLKQ